MTTTEFSNQIVGLQESLGRFAYKLTANREEARDLVQETIYKALSNQDKFEDETNLKSWTFTILKNTFINSYRRNTRFRVILDQTQDLYFISKPQDSGFISPDSNFSVKEIRKAINLLKDDYRIPFIMHTEGYKYKEIADEIGIPIGSVKSRIFIARKKLMSYLKDFQ
ncbi:MAG: RNA polymerase sigma factor [Salinivirgaceae bacterium]|jgi:RNA polymerase sigma-70 factor (ECF subfamily)|nr:RNA polymerase sigma factor [Bacteroidales bacterium]